jgi:tRNA(His) 5'-end guanylyltransferase
LRKYFASFGRSFIALTVASTVWLTMPNVALSNIYDTKILQRMKFTPDQRAKVRKIIAKSDREMAVIFRKYGINPNAKPEFEKLQRAGNELQAVEAREKRSMKKILSADQYKRYLDLLQRTAAQVIKATRTKP